MSSLRRFIAFGCLLVGVGGPALLSQETGPSPGAGPASSTFSSSTGSFAATSAVSAEGLFPEEVETQIAGRSERMRLTGTGLRKKFGIKFFQIAAYCDDDVAPRNVDELAAADVPKQLVLVMQRDVAEWVLRRAFAEALARNDPDNKYPEKIETLLNHMTARPLHKGDRIVLTHMPQSGMACQVCDTSPIAVSDCEFAHLVWKIYMGPQGVCPDIRKGLGSRLAAD